MSTCLASAGPDRRHPKATAAKPSRLRQPGIGPSLIPPGDVRFSTFASTRGWVASPAVMPTCAFARHTGHHPRESATALAYAMFWIGKTGRRRVVPTIFVSSAEVSSWLRAPDRPSSPNPIAPALWGSPRGPSCLPAAHRRDLPAPGLPSRSVPPRGSSSPVPSIS